MTVKAAINPRSLIVHCPKCDSTLEFHHALFYCNNGDCDVNYVKMAEQSFEIEATVELET